MDGAAKGKPGPVGVGSVLRNYKGDVLYMFSKNVGNKDSNKADVIAILEALKVFVQLFRVSSVVESDSANAIHWVSNLDGSPWKFHFLLSKIKALSSSGAVSFSFFIGS